MAVNTAKSGAAERVAVGRVGMGRLLLAYAETLLLAVWLGAMAFFSFAVAPSAFQVLPTRHLSGQIVASTLGKVELLGLIVGPLLIVLQAVTWGLRREGKVGKGVKLALLVVMVTAAALSRLWVSATMADLRAAMGGMIDDIAPADPLRLRFNDMHQYSVGLMSAALFSGLAALFLTVRGWLKK